jgi:hypothetical protein
MSQGPQETITCPVCGFVAPAGADRCPRCQAPLTSGTPTPPQPPPQDQPPQPAQPQFPAPGGYTEPPPPPQSAAGYGPPPSPTGVGPSFPEQPAAGYGVPPSPQAPAGYGPPPSEGYRAGTGQLPGWSPPPKKSYTGLIITLVVLLVLILTAGAAGFWWVLTQSGPRDQAADDLTEAFASSNSDAGAVAWCDTLFGYGPDMIFEDQDECVYAYAEWFAELSDEDRDKFASVTVDSSTLATIDEGTYALRQSDLQRPDGDWGTYDDEESQKLIFVIQQVESQGGWRIVGAASEDFSLGIVPDEAEELVDSPSRDSGTA